MGSWKSEGLVVLLLCGACGGDDGAPVDAGGQMDSTVNDGGADAASDAVTEGAVDAAGDATADAAGDATADASADAAGDATTDAAADAAGDATADAGDSGGGCTSNADCAGDVCYEGSCLSMLNGCTPSAATDMTGMASVTITFGCAGGCAYSPSCVLVDEGTTVTFSGTFTAHSLVGGVFDVTEMPGGVAPLDGRTDAGSTADFTFSEIGTYPYYCDQHSGVGMYGAIFVQ